MPPITIPSVVKVTFRIRFIENGFTCGWFTGLILAFIIFDELIKVFPQIEQMLGRWP